VLAPHAAWRSLIVPAPTAGAGHGGMWQEPSLRGRCLTRPLRPPSPDGWRGRSCSSACLPSTCCIVGAAAAVGGSWRWTRVRRRWARCSRALGRRPLRPGRAIAPGCLPLSRRLRPCAPPRPRTRFPHSGRQVLRKQRQVLVLCRRS
jgi:hypothetical protein